MHQAVPVRKWAVWRIRYITGSRINMLGWAMSILALSTLEPSPKRPARMWRSRLRFSSTERSRQGLPVPVVRKSPRVAEMVSASWSST